MGRGKIKKVYPMNEPPKDLIDNFTQVDTKIGVFATGEEMKEN